MKKARWRDVVKNQTPDVASSGFASRGKGFPWGETYGAGKFATPTQEEEHPLLNVARTNPLKVVGAGLVSR